MVKKIWSLAVGGLAIGTTEFLIMGILQNIGQSMGISDAQN
ncbi:hypothetical protein [Capnocytophaga catalasegens]|nr:hypothetical protein [Capnocytophaga catalasegens]